MKKASKILFLISGILTIIAAVVFLVLAIVYLVYGGIVAGIVNGTINPLDLPQPVIEAISDLAKSLGVSGEALANQLISTGVYFLITFFVAIAAVVLSFICKAKDYRPLPLLIVATVLCGAAWSICGIVGGILGIVNWAVFERKEVAQKAE